MFGDKKNLYLLEENVMLAHKDSNLFINSLVALKK
jgi:hypothetical protein